MNIVIVEDEESVQKGMGGMLHKINPDYELIGAASDNQEGMELIRKKRPDLVIIDIDVLQGSGLEILENMRQEGNTCEVILLSGKAEYQSVREAIELGISGYLLKPVEIQELSRAMELVETRLKKKKMEKRRYSLKKVLTVALAGQTGHDEHIEGLLRSNDGFDVKEKLGIFMVWLGNGYKELADIVVNSMKRTGENSRLFKACVLRYPDRRVILTVMYGLKSTEEVTGYLRQNVAAMIENQTNGKSVTGLCFCDGIDKAQKAAVELYGVLDYNMTVGRKVLLEYDKVIEMEIKHFRYPMELESSVKNAFKNRDEKAFAKCCKVLLNEDTVKGCNPKDIKEACMRYCYVLLHITKECGALNEKEQPVQMLFQEIDKAVTVEELRDAMQNFFVRSVAGSEKMPAEEKSILVERAKRLIAEYYNQGITLEEVAEKLSVSGEYLSTRIKKETGETFSEIIRRYRIDKVKELLISTNLKLNQIAVRAGYTNPKYMSKVFKEETGLLPLEYRKRNS